MGHTFVPAVSTEPEFEREKSHQMRWFEAQIATMFTTVRGLEENWEISAGGPRPDGSPVTRQNPPLALIAWENYVEKHMDWANLFYFAQAFRDALMSARERLEGEKWNG